MGNEKEKQGFYMINRRIGSTIYRGESIRQ